MTYLIKRGKFHLSSPAGLYEKDTESQDKRIHTRFSRVVHVVRVFDLIASGGIVFLLFFFFLKTSPVLPSGNSVLTVKRRQEV